MTKDEAFEKARTDSAGGTEFFIVSQERDTIHPESAFQCFPLQCLGLYFDTERIIGVVEPRPEPLSKDDYKPLSERIYRGF